jgi:hypothetical protein
LIKLVLRDQCPVHREKMMRLASDEPEYIDQVPRRAAYEATHPDVTITFHGHHWQAVIPEPRGEMVITRYTLKVLLDKLDELTRRAGS